MNRIGMQLLQDAKSAISAGEKEAGRRDLLSLLVQSNMSDEIPETQRLSDAVVIARAHHVHLCSLASRWLMNSCRAAHVLRCGT
jgi:hypothetical protein